MDTSLYLKDAYDAKSFRSLRLAYGITQQMIASRAGFARSVISTFENGKVETREETWLILKRTLINMIEEIGSIPVHDIQSYYNIRSYLSENRITIDSFEEMCGIGKRTFYPYSFKEGLIPKYMIEKIKAATGWTDDQIKNGNLKGGNEMSYVPVLKRDINLEEDNCDETKKYGTEYFMKMNSPEIADVFYDNSDRQIKNERYDCLVDRDTGVKTYICEYDEVITRHHTKTITREEFLKEV
jgi:DNA-binding XRE family transcriptional regulator